MGYQEITFDPSNIAGTYHVMTNPGVNTAVTTAIVDDYAGIVVTLTTTGNAQTLQSPTDTAQVRWFTIANNDTSTNDLTVNTVPIPPGTAMMYMWDGTMWSALNTVFAPTGTITFATAPQAIAGSSTTTVISPSTLTSRLGSPGVIGGVLPDRITGTILRLVPTDVTPTVPSDGWLWYRDTENSIYLAVE